MPKHEGWLNNNELGECMYMHRIKRKGLGDRGGWPLVGVALTRETHGYCMWEFDNRESKDVEHERTECWEPVLFLLNRDAAIEAAVDRARELGTEVHA